MSRLIILFLILSVTFAAAHQIAVAGSLYWYYWWFDVLMHFWGGLLIGLGVHALCRLQSITLKPSLLIVVVTISLIVISWEVFERAVGLFDPASYWLDTSQDVALGFGGGLLAHFLLQHLYNRRI